MSADGWLPPDQVATTKWPVVGERAPTDEALDLARWSLTLAGLVDEEARFTWADVKVWPTQRLEMDVHCVTRWSRKGVVFEGVPLAWLLDHFVIDGRATSVRFVAWSDRDHDSSLPLAVALADAWLIHSADGAPLAPEHGGPLRVVTRGRYFYKSLKWVRRIELRAEHTLGYWEREDGYHDNADPWPGDERYITGNLKPAALARFKARTQFSAFYAKTVRRADLRGWVPATTTLGPLRLKGCDLRGAVLRGADLRGANLSLSDLRGADLRGADLRGADLEGAFFAGADLRGADLRSALLTATTFFDATSAAQLDGADLRGTLGLLSDQQAWLVEKGHLLDESK